MWLVVGKFVGGLLRSLFLAAYKAASLIFLALWRGEKARRKMAENIAEIRKKQLEIANRNKLRRDELLERMRRR